jgi:3-methyladenine DNA glycosylase AlkD
LEIAMNVDQLAAIQQHLKSNHHPDTVAALAKVVPTGQRVLGVRVPVLNALAKEHKAGGLELARRLWQAGAFEERLLATKIIGKNAAKNSSEALQLIKALANELSDWAVCDTLGMEGTRPLLKKLGPEIWALALQKLAEPGEWQRRFGLVLLTHFVASPSHRPEIERLLAALDGDKRHYVKKAVAWVRRDLAKL